MQAPLLTVTTTSLPAGTVGATYTATVAASGGTTPYSWSIVNGSLPGGLTLNATSGVISGTPTAAATFNFTVQVSDAGDPVQTASKALSITVVPSLTSITVTPANPSILTGGTQQFTATGHYSDGSTQNLTSLATWSSSSPTVATVNSGGLASGLSAGTTTISAGVSAVSGSTTLTVQAPLVVTTASLPGGTVGTSYSATLAASGGTAPYTWSIVGGRLIIDSVGGTRTELAKGTIEIFNCTLPHPSKRVFR